jgi:hypothetical protein
MLSGIIESINFVLILRIIESELSTFMFSSKRRGKLIFLIILKFIRIKLLVIICPICFLFSGSAFPGQRIAVNISVQHGLLRLKNLNGVLFIAGEVSSFYIGFFENA